MSDLDKFETVSSDAKGNPIYILPANKNLYNGSNNINQVLSDATHAFFALDPEIAKQFGAVKRYTTNNELNLVAFEYLTVKHTFYKECSGLIQQKLKNHFMDERDSVTKEDNAIMSELCKQGYDGYASNRRSIKDDTIDGMFAEVVLCKPGSDVKLEGFYKNYSESERNEFKLNLQSHKDVRERQRKKEANRDLKTKPVTGTNLFGNHDDSDDDSDDDKTKTPVSRKLFGGNKSIKRKTRKGRKSNKRKTNKHKTNKRKSKPRYKRPI